MSFQQTPHDKDPQLWETAKRRVDFKSHLTVYIIINVFLWALWYFGGYKNYRSSLPWPAWTTLGWGVGVAFHFISAYVLPKSGSVEQEYQKLKRQQPDTNH
jgi:hypothetical protein